jgi:tRNA U34 5-carboxymethylaminomethyl modifying enzyme MnmG/GidA
MGSFILAKNNLVADGLQKKQQQVSPNNWLNLVLKATASKQVRRQGLMAEASTTARWKNRKAMMKSLDFLIPIQNALNRKNKEVAITYTNDTVHDILKTGFDRSPMFQGRIEGVGPRYCPSIEDKINRFAEGTGTNYLLNPKDGTRLRSM